MTSSSSSDADWDSVKILEDDPTTKIAKKQSTNNDPPNTFAPVYTNDHKNTQPNN